MSKGGGGNAGTNTIQQSDPWGGIQPYLLDTFREAQRLYQDHPTGPNYYPGRTFAPFRDEELIGQQVGINAAFRQLPRIADQANNALAFGLSPGLLSPTANPYLGAHAEAMIDPITRTLTEDILPQIRRSSQMAGQDAGSSRSQLAQGLAVDRATQNMLNATASLYSGAYGQGLGHMRGMMGYAPSVAGLNLVPSQTLRDLGAERRAMDQAGISEAMARYSHGEAAPFESFLRYANTIQPGAAGLGGTQTTESENKAISGNKTLGALGGALTGYSVLGPMIQSAAFGGIGAGTAASSPLWALSGPAGLGLGIGLGALGGLAGSS